MADRTEVFEGLKWAHVLVMTSVLRESDYTKTEHIKRRYDAQASRFEDTLAFMASLGAAVEQEGHVLASGALRVDDEVKARSWLAEQLLSSRNRYRTRILEYLRKFSVVDGRLVCRPCPTDRHLDSYVRNFLMEMGVICHDASHDIYVVTPEHLALHASARDETGRQTPSMVQAACRAREAFGLAAERAVVSYERDRVGAAFADRVVHVSLENAAAGYDVRSVTLDGSGTAVPRYIEVKAVSASSLEFHWTRNEVLTARALAEWYYLYLVPAKAAGRLAIDELEMLARPLDAVLHGPDRWAVEPDGFRCCLRKERIPALGVSDEE